MAVEIFSNKARVEILGCLARLAPGEKLGRAQIVEETALDPVLIGRHLVVLEQLGLVEVDQPWGDRRGTRPNYWLNRDKAVEIYNTLGVHLGFVVPRDVVDVEAIDQHLDQVRVLLHRT